MREHALVVTLKEDEYGWLVSLYDLTDPDPNRLPVAEGYAKDWRKAVEKALKKIDLPEETDEEDDSDIYTIKEEDNDEGKGER